MQPQITAGLTRLISNSRGQSRILFLFALIAIFLPGCGGGGGGNGDSNSGSAPANTRSITAVINWPQRSKSVNAPSSALSAVILVPGAAADGSNLSWILNRSDNSGAYNQSATSPVFVKFGQYTGTVQFFAAPNGGGDSVGQASFALNLTSNSSADIGNITVGTRVKSVAIVPQIVVGVGSETPVGVTPKDANGTMVAVSDGSAVINITDGGDKIDIVQNRVRGKANGLAHVTATIDGVTSAPQAIGVGQEPVTFTVKGARGVLPIAINNADPAVVGNGINASGLFPWYTANTLIAPPRYGDRAFAGWEVNGTMVDTNPSPAALPALGANDVLTAVYKPSPSDDPSGKYFPNYNKDDNLHWNHFPVTIWFDPSIADSVRQIILRGMNRWVNASGGAVSYTVTGDKVSAGIEVSFANLGKSRLGLTYDQFDTDSRELTKATLQLDSSMLPADTANTASLLEVVSSHEFGHALGIISVDGQGHSADTRDTMYPAISLDVTVHQRLTTRDFDTVTNLYPATFNGRHRAESAPAATAHRNLAVISAP